jgi:hypothetical protein
MDVSVLIARARSGLGKKTAYSSPGKMPPFSANAWPHGAKNDCSGFVSWCLRFSESRKVEHPLYKKVNGGWFETTAIHWDGLEASGYFTRRETATPGALLVYPDSVDSQGQSHDGHIGIVLSASGPGVAGVTEVIHCSLGGFKQHQDAIQVTDAKVWTTKSDSLIVWLEGVNA